MRVKDFTEFLNESTEFILESKVIYSDKFRNILKGITHEISSELINIENKDIDIKSNFFDIGADNDKISFSPDAKAQKLLLINDKKYKFIGYYRGWLLHRPANEQIFDKLGYVPEGDTFVPNPTQIGVEISRYTTERGNIYLYLKFENGKGVYNLQYLSTDNVESVWLKNRQLVKVGKGIKAILDSNGIDKKPKEIEEFVNLYKVAMDKLNDVFSYIELVKGKDIAKWYNYSTYEENSGTLGQSCMKSVDAEFFDIYVDNPEVCSLLILKSKRNTDKIVARALVWKLDCGKTFLDRVYSILDSDLLLLKEYAKNNGWYSRKTNSYEDISSIVDELGEVVNFEAVVTVSSDSYGYYPYMDTLKNWTYYENKLSSWSSSDSVLLDSTNGDAGCETCGGSGVLVCDECNSGSNECDGCEGSGEVECDVCEGSGEVECDQCDGDGMIDGEVCQKCSKSGRIECIDCGVRSTMACGECDGDGEIDCTYCNGRGEVDCYDCN